EREMLASGSLLEELSAKLADYCQSGFKTDDRTISSEEMGEFYYGSQKGHAFESIAKQYADDPKRRESYDAFIKLVDAYDAFVGDADKYRLSSARDPNALPSLMKERDAVAFAAESVRAALR
ncbi:MAG TPA: hypothetical protein VEF03_00635, partial [Candidatus Binataceae bacterium]|nr:hypothetical protein [Candidatus Binataceae bacterium]